MKLTTEQLKHIIKDELAQLFNEGKHYGNPHYSDGAWGQAFEDLHMATEPSDPYSGELDISFSTLDDYIQEMVSAKYHNPQDKSEVLENFIYYRDEIMKTDLSKYKRSIVGPLIDQVIKDLSTGNEMT